MRAQPILLHRAALDLQEPLETSGRHGRLHFDAAGEELVLDLDRGEARRFRERDGAMDVHRIAPAAAGVEALHKMLTNPEMRERFDGPGIQVVWTGPQEFSAFVKNELVKWTATIKEAGIEPE